MLRWNWYISWYRDDSRAMKLLTPVEVEEKDFQYMYICMYCIGLSKKFLNKEVYVFMPYVVLNISYCVYVCK